MTTLHEATQDLQDHLIGQRIGTRFENRSANTVLEGHKDEASAYVVDDYPYGYRERTKIRYWLETAPKKGARFVSQTLNPKTQRWNAPKKGTYVLLGGVMFLDSNGHVQWDGLSEYTDAAKATAFVQKYPRAELPLLKVFAKLKLQHNLGMADGTRWMTMNGVKQQPSPEDIGRWKDEAEQWSDLLGKL